MGDSLRRYVTPIAQCLLLQAGIISGGCLWLGWLPAAHRTPANPPAALWPATTVR